MPKLRVHCKTRCQEKSTQTDSNVFNNDLAVFVSRYMRDVGTTLIEKTLQERCRVDGARLSSLQKENEELLEMLMSLLQKVESCYNKDGIEGNVDDELPPNLQSLKEEINSDLSAKMAKEKEISERGEEDFKLLDQAFKLPNTSESTEVDVPNSYAIHLSRNTPTKVQCGTVSSSYVDLSTRNESSTTNVYQPFPNGYNASQQTEQYTNVVYSYYTLNGCVGYTNNESVLSNSNYYQSGIARSVQGMEPSALLTTPSLYQHNIYMNHEGNIIFPQVNTNSSLQ